MKMKEGVMDEWLHALEVMHIGHHKAASYYSKWHIWMGISVIVISTFVGTSIITSVAEIYTVAYVELIAGILSFIAASLAGIQTFLNLESRIQKHHSAAAGFGKVRRQLEQLVHLSLHDVDIQEKLDEIRSSWDEVLGNAPNLPAHIHDPLKAEKKKDQ
ncbi:SLATT domain-containing protein [Aliifodinibius sp. S!AR15-10]|uniref:SLATT domain-containing protein n=1 Tax=Aliifodinibius sp. S!AR15-10 TaxID=2950437 RepID=UPI002864D724|nr:SLATT domain-containing protein [Aliifodinibius sp. S!AR15-10]MDR8391895.1 SLATT domain-containing protein [Aliifodinibius sp. S!AR15-10]